MKVYGVAQSPFVRKVRIVLEEKGLPYELETPIPGLHPMGKMPVLRHGEVVVPDSSVISAYLEKTPTSASGQPIPPVLDYLESQLPGDRDTVLARFSIADVALGAHLEWLPLADIELDDGRWPKTARYRAALAARPSFRATAA